ncbi:MAG: tRNA (N(6)-L-threonylcarbamoyladenosine(37)-C(2))-methylthiotransferase MtaB [Deltaproteobacteria bacterium]|nr:tRNA (N(6)-L-threonylcarbamoyladenosine(37)-C(2))-methylthiotransferase MtaB [Deltaproteobacteria bacterium]
MTRSFKIITLGCKVNQYESACLDEALHRAGWRRADDPEPGDAVIVNTCIVTIRAAHQSRQAIRKAIRENGRATVAAVGCYAQAFPQEIVDIEGVHIIADNRKKGRLVEYLQEASPTRTQTLALQPFEPETPFEFLDIRTFPGRTRAYLKIQDGCESFCSYCIVPFTRGPCRSLPPEKALFVLKQFAAQGFREVVLTGIHLGRYGTDLGPEYTLNTLLKQIEKEGLPLRIRLSSLEPNEIDEALIDMVADCDWLCRHFHIPLQSGDDRVLKRMNRHVTQKEFARLVETIHARIPRAAIGVDVMAGFPGEDPIAHGNTCSLIRDLPVSYLHVFPFSPRPGTSAASFQNRVDPGLVKERAAQLRALGRKKRLQFYASCLDDRFDVLIETWHDQEKGRVKGTSDNYLPVIFPSDTLHQGQLIRLCVAGVSDHGVTGVRED